MGPLSGYRDGCKQGMGYGMVWYGKHSPRNYSAHVPAHERQSISRGELRGVLHATLGRLQGDGSGAGLRVCIQRHHSLVRKVEMARMEDVVG